MARWVLSQLQVDALSRLASVADAYELNDLDEARAGEEHTPQELEKIVILSGRGGRTLLTLADAFAARKALREVQSNEAAGGDASAVEAPWREAAALSLRQHSYVSPPGPCLCAACELHRKLLGEDGGG